MVISDETLAAALDASRRGQLESARIRAERTRAAIVEFLTGRTANGVQADYVAAATQVSLSTAKRHLYQLVKDGTVERFPDPHDARARRYRLTAQARP